MVRTIDIKINAAHPDLPLDTLSVFKDAPFSGRIQNIPKKIGGWSISKVFFSVTFPDNSIVSKECVNVGGVWVATVQGCATSGTSANGYEITANGIDENGNAVTGYCFGRGDIAIMNRDGTITVGSKTYYFHLLDAIPASPKKGDAVVVGGSLKWYNGTSWVDFGGGADAGAVHKSDFAAVTPIGDTFTENEMKTKLNSIIGILKGATAALLAALCIYSAFGGIEIFTATKGDLPNTAEIVTNVTFTGSTDLTPATNYANRVAQSSTNYTDACCSTLAFAYTNYANRVASAATNYTDATAATIRGEIPDAYTKDEADAAFATKADELATRAIVQTWEGFLDGSNVVFSITNYISGSYNLEEAKLRIMEMTNGVYREVYNSRGEIVMHIENFKTNDFRVATNSVITAVNSAMSQKADKAWGKYTSAGGEAPSNTVYMTAPNTVFAGGLEYERVAVGEGAVCILTTKGAPVWTQGDEGTFKFQDDGGTNYFGFAKTDSYTLGAHTDGISVANSLVTLTYNVTMSGVPCIWYKADIASATPWEQLNTPDGNPIAGASHSVSWDPSPNPGTEVCWINCPEAKGFFKATIEVAGEAKFTTNMPADLGGGIICTNSAAGRMGVIKPTYNGSTVTWTWSEL